MKKKYKYILIKMKVNMNYPVTLLAGGLAGGVLSNLNKTEKFQATEEQIVDNATLTAVIVIAVLIALALTVILCISVYRIMPSFKIVHVLLTLILGGLWLFVVFIYYGIFTKFRLVETK